MSVSTYTNHVMKALPAALRPNPNYIDEYVNNAVAKGWTPNKLAETSFMNRQNMNPALVAHNIKNLSQHAPAPTPKQHHNAITYPTHTMTMPEWFKRAQATGTKEAFTTELTALGLDVPHLTHLQDTHSPHLDQYIETTLNTHRTPSTHAPTTPLHAV